MGTNIRSEVSRDNPYWIPRQRYFELKHFCMQYGDWLKELRSIELTHGNAIEMIVNNGEFNDPVYKAAEKRERYLTWLNIVEQAVRNTTPSVTLGELLLEGIVKGISYDKLEANEGGMPCSKDAFYNLYRKFFFELDKIRG